VIIDALKEIDDPPIVKIVPKDIPVMEIGRLPVVLFGVRWKVPVVEPSGIVSVVILPPPGDVWNVSPLTELAGVMTAPPYPAGPLNVTVKAVDW